MLLIFNLGDVKFEFMILEVQNLMDVPKLVDGWVLMQKPKTDIAFTGQKRDRSLWKEALNSILKMRLKSRSYHLEKSISNPKRHLLKLLMGMLKRRTSLKKFHPPKVKVNGSGKNLVISGG